MICNWSFNAIVRCSRCYNTVQYVPKHSPVTTGDIQHFTQFIDKHFKILVLSGAGVSTESGIPDYRSEGVGLYARSNHKPVQYQEFVAKQQVRKKYWARNYVGWPRFSKVNPNVTHLMLADLERRQKVFGIVTQNVDSLHTKAGSRNIVELHGSSNLVKCLNCPYEISRHSFQEILAKLNPDMRETSNFIRPDGDVDLSEEQVSGFVIPKCSQCGSMGSLKPDIVFFGDNVPKQRVEKVKDMVYDCDALLVLGSSLTVFSSYRIVLQAAELCKYIMIVNIGPTRGDQHANVKLSAKCSDLLMHVR